MHGEAVRLEAVRLEALQLETLQLESLQLEARAHHCAANQNWKPTPMKKPLMVPS